MLRAQPKTLVFFAGTQTFTGTRPHDLKIEADKNRYDLIGLSIRAKL